MAERHVANVNTRVRFPLTAPIRGLGPLVGHQPSKLLKGVRFSQAAPVLRVSSSGRASDSKPDDQRSIRCTRANGPIV